MKKLESVRAFFVGLWHLWYMKYVVVCVIGVLIVGFLDENSVWNHFNNMQRISELEVEIDHYTQLNEKNKQRIKQLEKDPKAIEKIARERYFMKADDEDIFVLSDDEEVKENVEYEAAK